MLVPCGCRDSERRACRPPSHMVRAEGEATEQALGAMAARRRKWFSGKDGRDEWLLSSQRWWVMEVFDNGINATREVMCGSPGDGCERKLFIACNPAISRKKFAQHDAYPFTASKNKRRWFPRCICNHISMIKEIWYLCNLQVTLNQKNYLNLSAQIISQKKCSFSV